MVKSFKEFLGVESLKEKARNIKTPQTPQTPQTLLHVKRELLVDTKWMNETLDSAYNIIEKESNGNIVEYLVQTDSMKFYKIYVESISYKGNLYIDAGFRRNIGGNNWTVDGIINDLTSTELLRLFGTMKKNSTFT